jgi:hypothetical protein
MGGGGLGKKFGLKRDEVTREWRRLQTVELYDLHFSQNIICVVKKKEA